MPITVLKKCCERCGKAFFTYETDKMFCTSTCEVRKKYDTHFGRKQELKENYSNCEFCREIIHTKGLTERRFCNYKCKKDFVNQENRNETIKKSMKATDPNKKKKKGISYEELNRRAEWKMVYEDHDFMYNQNRERV